MKNDLTSHIINTVEHEFEHFLFIGLGTVGEDNMSEFVYQSNGDVSVLRGLAEAALHSLQKEEDKNENENRW